MQIVTAAAIRSWRIESRSRTVTAWPFRVSKPPVTQKRGADLVLSAVAAADGTRVFELGVPPFAQLHGQVAGP
jgi:hypothetical protein